MGLLWARVTTLTYVLAVVVTRMLMNRPAYPDTQARFADLIALLVPTICYWIVMLFLVNPPAAFRIDSRASRFTVPAAPGAYGFLFVALVGAQPLGAPGTPLPLNIAIVLLLCWTAIVSSGGHSLLTMDPQGLTVRRFFFLRRTFSWSELGPIDPEFPNDPKALRNLRFPVFNRRRTGALYYSMLYVAPGFLYQAVQRYASDPIARAAIGTAEELDHLKADYLRRPVVV